MLRLMILLLASLISTAYARDPEGKYANSPLKHWFDGLANKHSQLCCSVADGRTLEDPDVETRNNQYWVRIDGTWYPVPDEALVTVPNKFGQPVVWPIMGLDGKLVIRCFMPGAGL